MSTALEGLKRERNELAKHLRILDKAISAFGETKAVKKTAKVKTGRKKRKMPAAVREKIRVSSLARWKKAKEEPKS